MYSIGEIPVETSIWGSQCQAAIGSKLGQSWYSTFVMVQIEVTASNVMQRQTAVPAHLKKKQLLLFAFALQSAILTEAV